MVFSAVNPRATATAWVKGERGVEKGGMKGNRRWEEKYLAEQEEDTLKRVRLIWRDLLFSLDLKETFS